ncbi:serine/threonine-protein kinase PLK1-like [Vespa velutina]|uniref:serine/threonine-protein kinase PLK1-like n=1 Tax=Vespa velutina TaxID=202808 RepID=UPI001FB2B487|nr:serine/threonine-protein kinase PLK1-like [Vespa velutina]
MPALPSTIESRHIDDVTPPPMIASSPSSSASSSASSSTSSPPAPRMTSPPNVATATCYLPESRLISRSIVSTRYPEEIEETARSNSASTGSTGSSKSADARPRQSLSKSSASLRSLVRRKSRRQVGGSATVSGGSSSIIESNNDSRHSRHQGSEDGLHRRRESTGGEEETTMYTSGRSSARRASSVVRGTMVAGIVGGQDNNNIGQDASSSISNVVFVAPTVVSNANRFVRTTSSSLVRATSVPTTPGPSTSNSSSHWNNSSEQETDYVVDPVQGKAYYKGQFLGRGGFARVYLMTDVSDGNQYACKIIPKNRMQKIHMQKIAREIIIHKELNHVNVVQMHHYFEDNLNVYMLLEACPRKSLMHVLKYRGKVTEPEARYYMKQMVTGVAYIHSQKVVHRDLKPGNMFLSDRMIVKIGDFGLATRPDGQRRRVTICGTPNYIAPEVLYKQAYSYEADVWALGCILYALLVGQPPFDTATLKETYARICKNDYREVDDSIASRSGQNLINWLLQPDPELRPSSERVKEHPYLTKEYIPPSLPHTCCYQMPHATILEPASSSPSSVSTASRNQELGKTQAWQSLDHPNISPRSQQRATMPNAQQPMQNQQLLERSQKNIQKDSKVSNWLVRKLPKLPKFKQRLSSVLCPDHKKTSLLAQSVQMHRALESCVSEMKRNNLQQNPPGVEDIVPLFVTKWIDYSNKYGLGFQLSDKSVGVLFNDNTKISYTHDRRRVEYMTIDDEVTRYHRERDIPVPLQKKLELLHHFTQYMDEFLTEGGEIKKYRTTMKQSKNAYVPRMRRWLRTDKAIVMELTVPLLQVNFFVDHTKIIVSQETGKGYLITYINTGRHVSSYWLNDLRDFGCTADLYERLYYVCKVTREFAELDNNTIA